MSNISPTYEKIIPCTLCGHSYSSLKVRTRSIKRSHADSDWCVHYENELHNPDLYMVFVCPQCGFASTEKFKSLLSEARTHVFKQQITLNWIEQHHYSSTRTPSIAINSYKLAALCAELIEEPCATIAGLYLRIAWFYRKELNSDQEQRFLRIALQFYNQSYENGDYEKVELSVGHVLYLIAELHARTYQITAAMSQFAKLISHAKVKGTTLEKTTRERYQELRQTHPTKETL
ncbi:MAG: DUF2225 domain-containing protein [Bacilli bacterium]